MASLISLLLLSGAMLLQNSVVGRLNMLQGAADLLMLVLISWILQADEKRHWQWGLAAGLLAGVSSAVPVWVPVVGYTTLVLLITLVQQQVWQVPIWLLLVSTFFGTFIVYGLEVLYLWGAGVAIDLGEALNLVLLPSLMLNMIVVLPIYAFIGEIAKQVYPKEVEE